jgi:hypothetical protein
MRNEQGSSVVEGLIALGLVCAVFAIGAELMLEVQARTIATAAAQAGVRGAAAGGPAAGLAAAQQVLDAGGGLGRRLAASVDEQGDVVSATVAGEPPMPFAVGIVLPAIDASASAPLEQYPADEANTR